MAVTLNKKALAHARNRVKTGNVVDADDHDDIEDALKKLLEQIDA